MLAVTAQLLTLTGPHPDLADLAQLPELLEPNSRPSSQTIILIVIVIMIIIMIIMNIVIVIDIVI